MARTIAPGKKRIVFAEGEEERVLRAVQVVADEQIASPILIGRPAVIEQRIARYGLRLQAGTDFTVVNTENDRRYRDYCLAYLRLMCRRGVTMQYARLEMRRRNTLIGAMLLRHGEAEGMICGTISSTLRRIVNMAALTVADASACRNSI